MIVMIIVTLLILGGYFSYAMFTVSKEKSNAISIVTGNLIYDLKVDGEESNILSVPANTRYDFIVTLSNPNNRIARFNFYYEGELPDGVDIGYVEEDDYNIPPSEVGVNLEKVNMGGSSNKYKIRVANITDNEVIINLGISVGLDYNDLRLPSGGHLFRKITSIGTIKEVLEDDIMSRLNYEDYEQTFITGSNPYNYIWYSGKLWRVVSFDTADNSAKLVTEWGISSIPYNSWANSKFDGSHMEMWLNDITVDGFLYNLRDYEKYIKTDTKWNATMTTSTTKPAKTTMVENPVGLLNIYEYTMSYRGTTCSEGYLNNGQYAWTLTPYSNENGWLIIYDGTSENQWITRNYAVRPSIVLKANVNIVDGNGTIDNPYRLEGDNDKDLNGVNLNTRYSGEYVIFGKEPNSLYRIVSHEVNNLTKITSAEPLKIESSLTFYTKKFNSTAGRIRFNPTDSSYELAYYLNSTYLQESDLFSNLVESSVWYLGTISDGSNYRLAKYTNTNANVTTSTKVTAKVGLLRLGELMTGQFERGTARDNKESNSTISYWTLTPSSSSLIWYVDYRNGGSSSSAFNVTTSLGVKPTLNLKENIIITEGDGTKENPFELSVQ